MRIAAFGAGVLLSVLIFSAQAPKASAESVSSVPLESVNQFVDKLAVLEMVEDHAEPEVPAPVEPTKHKVLTGETLTSIAEQHETSWQRLFAKNIELVDPNVLTPDMELVIPLADEELPERPVISVPAAPAKTKQAVQVSRGSTAGNTYTPGYCTWYAKNRRPDLPNNLGNAYTWVSRAAAQGIPTGSTPQVGAIGQQGNHVVYVEAVNTDGTVTISEMNSQALYEITSRTVPASYFQYIY